MRKTVQDTNDYIEKILADYPYFPDNGKLFLAEEATALQRGYFSLFPEIKRVSAVLSGNKTVALSALAETDGVPEAEDICAVFHGKKELPQKTLLQYLRSDLPAFTVEREQILCRSEEKGSIVGVLCKYYPQDISYTDVDGYVGEICIPKEHLPFLSARLREMTARLCGEEEEADHFADCYNAWLEKLQKEGGREK